MTSNYNSLKLSIHFFLDKKTNQKNQDFLKNYKKILQNPHPQIKRTPLSGSNSFLSSALTASLIFNSFLERSKFKMNF